MVARHQCPISERPLKTGLTVYMYSEVSLIRNPLNRKPRYPEMVSWFHMLCGNGAEPDQRAPIGAL